MGSSLHTVWLSDYNHGNSKEFGIGVPTTAAAISRNNRTFCGFSTCAPFLVAQTRSRKTRRLNSLRCGPGTPTRLGYLPDWRQGGSHSQTATLEANMAQTFTELDLAKLHLKLVFKSWEDEREQLYALVINIHNGLEPDPEADSEVLHEWRLSQVAASMLDDAREFHALKKMAGVAL